MLIEMMSRVASREPDNIRIVKNTTIDPRYSILSWEDISSLAHREREWGAAQSK